jgi:hypothetical protein
VTITISHLIARWFNDRGVGSDAVTGTRFLLTFWISAAIEATIGQPMTGRPLAALPLLALTAFAVVTIPSFSLRSRGHPHSRCVRSGQFAVQQFDGRLKFSGATLLCIAGFAFSRSRPAS